MSAYLTYVLEFEFIRFGLIGAIGMVAYYTVYGPCVLFKKEWYVLWMIVAFVALVFVSFPLQKEWTFQNFNADTAQLHFTLFGVQRSLFHLVNMWVVRKIVRGFEPPVLRARVAYVKLHEFWAQVLSHALFALPSYVATKLIFLIP